MTDPSARPALVAWLDQPGLDVSGADTLVLGGTDADVAELRRRGAVVTRAGAVLPADAPSAWDGAFGLVVDLGTLGAVVGAQRDAAMRRLAGFVAPGGFAVVVTSMATSDAAAGQSEGGATVGPVTPVTPAELASFRAAGLERVALAHPPAARAGDVMEIVVTFERPADDQPSTSSATSSG